MSSVCAAADMVYDGNITNDVVGAGQQAVESISEALPDLPEPPSWDDVKNLI